MKRLYLFPMVTSGVLLLALSCSRPYVKSVPVDPPGGKCDGLVFYQDIPEGRRTNTDETRVIVSRWQECAQHFESAARRNKHAADNNAPDSFMEDTFEFAADWPIWLLIVYLVSL